ncbi:hypothetical protein COY16_03485 [Candidatus Roizmanbacteria bacterium CG_4_10_14_0_2_um_filter_39_13]|uniref:Branched-chain amino acid aminotransferase n=1 Tax=Candidatus Roizmanbacteria bacterium CG_4_10_14_0_2_um_filter_39_13 TaxID=1974825 RepID=A0A2M7TYB9_9BACT|nr:MAG: hypothetical protein COY16_03485 [Candidatus Roizmanbacteria bacterium CG_4_10_14_0_2_um_filter_39_13]
MKTSLFSRNGKIASIDTAVVSIEKIERMYGFGVYESLKVRNNILYFVEQHVDRLMHSAQCINLTHDFTPTVITSWIKEFGEKIAEPSTNIKMLLLGGETPKEAELLLFPLAPFFPKKEWYRDGVTTFSFEYERWMPQSKSLNMLASYYYYNKSKKQGGYDALYVDHSGNIREGTRTNFYAMKGKKIISPPKQDVLEGVTMMTIEKVIESSDFTIEYRPISKTSLPDFDSVFLSSTSSKILPVASIDSMKFHISSDLKQLIQIYNAALNASSGSFQNLVVQ